jgi:RNA polymerase sigma-70 factor (ECF subfamily)
MQALLDGIPRPRRLCRPSHPWRLQDGARTSENTEESLANVADVTAPELSALIQFAPVSVPLAYPREAPGVRSSWRCKRMGSRTRHRHVADEALIRSLFAEHGHAMLAYATRLTGDRAAAEDVVQEALIKAWKNPDVLVNGKGSVRGWLLTVVRNIITDRFRARKARPQEVAESTATVPVERDHADKVVGSIIVLDALQQLPEAQRSVLVEIYVRGQSVNEAAETLGIPPGTVKSRSYYALRALRDLFSARETGLEGVA